jgi:hypothetical protein
VSGPRRADGRVARGGPAGTAAWSPLPRHAAEHLLTTLPAGPC